MAEQWRIFVVEEEEDLNQNIVSSLRKDGYIVNGMVNGGEAIRTLWAQEYDVVICNLKTPGADGFELLQWIRAYRPNTRVILVGDTPSASIRTQALEGGAVSYLKKPLDLHVLKEELRRLLVQTGFSADLDSFDLLDVIQIVSTSRRSIALLISTGLEERGMLCFQGGNLVWAEYGLLRGEEAFFALAAHKNGTVVHQPWNEQVIPNVTQPLSRLILQAFQYRTKYAQMQRQASGEQPVVRDAVSASEEDDDSPFLVLTEHAEQQTLHPPVAQEMPARAEIQQRQDGHSSDGVGVLNEAANGRKREWWEQTGKMSGVSKGTRSIPATPILEPIVDEGNGKTSYPFISRKVSEDQRDTMPNNGANRGDLPSWLTDQPTEAEMPAVRPSSLSGSAQIPKISSTPALKPSPAEWQPLQSQQVTQRPVASQGGTKVRSEGEKTGAQQSLPMNREGTRRISSPEWQASETMIQPRSGPLQSLAATRKTSDDPALNAEKRSGDHSGSNGQGGNAAGGQERQEPSTKRNYNYAALVSALQTLGYSINGFIAAAVVSMDGQPIAQVAVDDLDVSRMCKNFSLLMKSVLQSLDEGIWGEYEDTVITSADRHILMRVVGAERQAFQMLITAREAEPAESVAVMARVEGAITAALYQ